MSGGHFADLRLNGGSGQADEGFWPSFTDIMMVIVMIFLLASVVMLLRNMELVQQLRATMEAERQASQVARSTAEQKAALAERLAEAEGDVGRLRMELLLAREERAHEARKRRETEAALSEASARAERLDQQLADARERAAVFEQQASRSEERLAGLESAHQELMSRFQETSRRTAELEAERAAREDALTELRDTAEDAERQLALTRDEYSRLQQKYDRLIKPARSTAGKHVVEVRYSKSGDGYRIEFKGAGEQAFGRVSRKALESRLGELKGRHPGKLYVRIIIPEDSGLSYNEAWSFTNEILGRYDYYFQEPAAQGQ